MLRIAILYRHCKNKLLAFQKIPLLFELSNINSNTLLLLGMPSPASKSFPESFLEFSISAFDVLIPVSFSRTSFVEERSYSHINYGRSTRFFVHVKLGCV